MQPKTPSRDVKSHLRGSHRWKRPDALWDCGKSYAAVGCRYVDGDGRRRRGRPGVDEPRQTLAGDGQCKQQKSEADDGVAGKQLNNGERVHCPIAPVTRCVQRQLEAHLQTQQVSKISLQFLNGKYQTCAQHRITEN